MTGILHGKSASYLSVLMPNTFSMAPRYVRDFAARTAFASPERDVFDGLPKKLDRLFRQPPPRTEGLALLGDARDVAERAQGGAAARWAGRNGPGSSSPRRRTCGSSSTATTTGCGRGSWASMPARSTPRSTTPTIASRTSRSCVSRWPACARSSPTTRSSSSSSATSRRTAAARSAAASAWPSGSGRSPPSPRATSWPGSRSTTSPPTAR